MSTKDKLKIGVMDGGASLDFYQQNPCTAPYHYTRLEVSGEVRGCCIQKHHLGTTDKKTWSEIWHGQTFEAFRAKMKTIHETHFHLKDPEWGFCQQCSHRHLNENNAKLLNLPYEE